jgi:hypothetical protein
VAKRFIVNLCLIIWAERRLLGIEIPNEHLWIVQELCMESGRITGSEHDDGRPSDATQNPCLAITDGQEAEQIRDTMAAKTYKQVRDNKQAMKISQAYTDDEPSEPSEPEVMEVASAHYEACEEVQA